MIGIVPFCTSQYAGSQKGGLPDGGGGGGGAGSVLRVDSIAVVGSKLVDLTVSGIADGVLCYVGNDTFPLQPSVHRYYSARVGAGLTADGITIVDSIAMPGVQWVDTGTQQPGYQQQTLWAVDEGNASGLASDENLGFGSTLAEASAAPLLTHAELWRRWNGGNFGIIARQVLEMSDAIGVVAIPSTFRWDFSDQLSTNFPGYLAFVAGSGQGAVQTVLHTGTLTAGTVHRSGNTPGTVEDTALSGTGWAGVDALSGSAGFRFIRTPDGLNYAIMAHAIIGSPKKAQIWDPAAISLTPGQQISNTSSSAFVNGAAYEIVKPRTFPGLSYGSNVSPRLYGVQVMDDSVSPLAAQVTTGPCTLYGICSGFVNVNVGGQGGVRASVFGTFGCTMIKFDYTTAIGCGMLGNSTETPRVASVAETWAGVNWAPQNLYSLTACEWTNQGTNTGASAGPDLFLWETNSGFMKFQKPRGEFIVNTIAGVMAGADDRPVLVQVLGFFFGTTQTTFAACSLLNLHTGYLASVKGLFANCIGPPAPGVRADAFNDADTGIVFAENVFLA